MQASSSSQTQTPTLHLDIREPAPPQSTSATISPSGTNFIPSPITVSPGGSLPLSRCKDKSAPDEFKPRATRPAKSRRYDRRPFPDVCSRPIPAGPLSVSRERKYGLPPEWQEYIHPEGQIYFVHARESAPGINVITDAYAYDSKVQNAASDFADKLLARVASDFWTFDPAHVELMVDVDVDDPAAASYYFIDHENALIFGSMKSVSGIDNLRARIQTQYWLHQEHFHFPCHRKASEKDERELIATLAQNCIGIITSGVTGSNTSTAYFDGPQLESILGITNNLTNFEGNHGQRNWIVARLWKLLLTLRAVNHFGERGARLYRTQMVKEEDPLPIFMKFAFLLLFDAPSTHLRSLRELSAGNVVYEDAWRTFMEALCNDWHNMILWATVLLAANVSFLAIFNSTDQVIQESRAVTCSIVSTLSSTASIMIGMLLFLKHRSGPLAGRRTKNGVEYLSAPIIARLGMQILAIMYSLPYAYLIWAMVTYIAAIILFVFNSGLKSTSQVVIAYVAMGLGSLLFVVIVYFSEDELQLMDNLRSCRDSMRSLSPIGLVRLVGRVVRRGHNPEAANIAINIRPWVRRAMGSVNDPQESNNVRRRPFVV
ncbi:hypothetical protein JB92DRAFT_3150256 [Gautieria morchelliformis]|nr:hypothetical protein JB92DRAFT_3150256 [Gautieria morchelliformis]